VIFTPEYGFLKTDNGYPKDVADTFRPGNPWESPLLLHRGIVNRLEPLMCISEFPKEWTRFSKGSLVGTL